MRVVIAGSTGMVGKLLLKDCLSSNKIDLVYSFTRKKSGFIHPKLHELIVSDFEDYSLHEEVFTKVDTAFFCIGVYTGQVPDKEFRKITVDYAIAFAKALEKGSPGARICLLSGAGADRSEKSSTSFAKYKGMTENGISALNLRLYAFRPGYIYPVQKRKEPNIGYAILHVFYPILKLFGKKFSIRSTELAAAILTVGLHGADKEILENKDILTKVR